jgi:hypothetical protein
VRLRQHIASIFAATFQNKGALQQLAKGDLIHQRSSELDSTNCVIPKDHKVAASMAQLAIGRDEMIQRTC